jgi:hypothetical protein
LGDIIGLQYIDDGGQWTSEAVRRSHSCSLWRSIRMGQERFPAFVVFRVGDGSRMLPLCNLYEHLERKEQRQLDGVEKSIIETKSVFLCA